MAPDSEVRLGRMEPLDTPPLRQIELILGGKKGKAQGMCRAGHFL